ncbi:hypothetical protein Mapa_014695 [Marchantia paleacea]|nr:hypothetical protein Mapa_014695 [Marchantia paleacea]
MKVLLSQGSSKKLRLHMSTQTSFLKLLLQPHLINGGRFPFSEQTNAVCTRENTIEVFLDHRQAQPLIHQLPHLKCRNQTQGELRHHPKAT